MTSSEMSELIQAASKAHQRMFCSCDGGNDLCFLGKALKSAQKEGEI